MERLIVIRSLKSRSYELSKPIPAILEPIGTEGDNYVARFPEANVNASGNTAGEATDNLEDLIVATFENFSSIPNARLGPEPRRQLAVLREYLRERSEDGEDHH